MMPKGSRGLNLVRIASLYLLAGLVLGMVMAIRQDFTLVSVHTHIGLLGWAAMAITGLAYLALPKCSRSRLAAIHFWLHNVGVPLMLGSLAFMVLTGNRAAEPLIGLGGFLIIAGIVAFTNNVFVNARAAEAEGARLSGLGT
jgi:uncharacterized membrane protein YgdD (TMEM256/DUF423 family)